MQHPTDINNTEPTPAPKLLSKVSLSKTKLGLSYDNKKHWFDLDEQGRVNLIEIDMLLTQILKSEMQKVQLRKDLGGK